MPAVKNQKPRGRKSALIGLSLILSLLFLPIVGAGEYDYEINAYAVYFEVVSPDDVKETIEIDLTSYTNLTQYVIYTDYPVEDPRAVLDLPSGVKPVNVTVREVLGGTNAIYMYFQTLGPGESARIRLTFTTRGMVSESNGREQFTYYIRFSQPVGIFHMQLLVPKGYAILSPIIPSPDKVESSTDRLLLEWKRSSEEEKVHLRSDEEKVLAILREGPVLQSELAEKLGVSKAKVSIILREMEGKGLITRVKEGGTYRVFLKK